MKSASMIVMMNVFFIIVLLSVLFNYVDHVSLCRLDFLSDRSITSSLFHHIALKQIFAFEREMEQDACQKRHYFYKSLNPRLFF